MANECCYEIYTDPCSKPVTREYLANLTSCMRKQDGTRVDVSRLPDYPTYDEIIAVVPLASTATNWFNNVDGIDIGGSYRSGEGELVRICDITAYCTSMESISISNAGQTNCATAIEPESNCYCEPTTAYTYGDVSDIPCDATGTVNISVPYTATTKNEDCVSNDSYGNKTITISGLERNTGERKIVYSNEVTIYQAGNCPCLTSTTYTYGQYVIPCDVTGSTTVSVPYTATTLTEECTYTTAYGETSVTINGLTRNTGSRRQVNTNPNIYQEGGCYSCFCDDAMKNSFTVNTTSLSWTYKEISGKKVNVSASCGTLYVATSGNFNVTPLMATATSSGVEFIVTPKGTNDTDEVYNGSVTIRLVDGGPNECATSSVTLTQGVWGCNCEEIQDNYEISLNSINWEAMDLNTKNFTVNAICGSVKAETSGEFEIDVTPTETTNDGNNKAFQVTPRGANYTRESKKGKITLSFFNEEGVKCFVKDINVTQGAYDGCGEFEYETFLAEDAYRDGISLSKCQTEFFIEVRATKKCVLPEEDAVAYDDFDIEIKHVDGEYIGETHICSDCDDDGRTYGTKRFRVKVNPNETALVRTERLRITTIHEGTENVIDSSNPITITQEAGPCTCIYEYKIVMESSDGADGAVKDHKTADACDDQQSFFPYFYRRCKLTNDWERISDDEIEMGYGDKYTFEFEQLDIDWVDDVYFNLSSREFDIAFSKNCTDKLRVVDYTVEMFVDGEYACSYEIGVTQGAGPCRDCFNCDCDSATVEGVVNGVMTLPMVANKSELIKLVQDEGCEFIITSVTVPNDSDWETLCVPNMLTKEVNCGVLVKDNSLGSTPRPTTVTVKYCLKDDESTSCETSFTIEKEGCSEYEYRVNEPRLLPTIDACGGDAKITLSLERRCKSVTDAAWEAYNDYSVNWTSPYGDGIGNVVLCANLIGKYPQCNDVTLPFKCNTKKSAQTVRFKYEIVDKGGEKLTEGSLAFTQNAGPCMACIPCACGDASVNGVVDGVMKFSPTLQGKEITLSSEGDCDFVIDSVLLSGWGTSDWQVTNLRDVWTVAPLSTMAGDTTIVVKYHMKEYEDVSCETSFTALIDGCGKYEFSGEFVDYNGSTDRPIHEVLFEACETDSKIVKVKATSRCVSPIDKTTSPYADARIIIEGMIYVRDGSIAYDKGGMLTPGMKPSFIYTGEVLDSPYFGVRSSSNGDGTYDLTISVRDINKTSSSYADAYMVSMNCENVDGTIETVVIGALVVAVKNGPCHICSCDDITDTNVINSDYTWSYDNKDRIELMRYTANTCVKWYVDSESEKGSKNHWNIDTDSRGVIYAEPINLNMLRTTYTYSFTIESDPICTGYGFNLTHEGVTCDCNSIALTGGNVVNSQGRYIATWEAAEYGADYTKTFGFGGSKVEHQTICFTSLTNLSIKGVSYINNKSQASLNGNYNSIGWSVDNVSKTVVIGPLVRNLNTSNKAVELYIFVTFYGIECTIPFTAIHMGVGCICSYANIEGLEDGKLIFERTLGSKTIQNITATTSSCEWVLDKVTCPDASALVGDKTKWRLLVRSLALDGQTAYSLSPNSVDSVPTTITVDFHLASDTSVTCSKTYDVMVRPCNSITYDATVDVTALTFSNNCLDERKILVSATQKCDSEAAVPYDDFYVEFEHTSGSYIMDFMTCDNCDEENRTKGSRRYQLDSSENCTRSRRTEDGNLKVIKNDGELIESIPFKIAQNAGICESCDNYCDCSSVYTNPALGSTMNWAWNDTSWKTIYVYGDSCVRWDYEGYDENIYPMSDDYWEINYSGMTQNPKYIKIRPKAVNDSPTSAGGGPLFFYPTDQDGYGLNCSGTDWIIIGHSANPNYCDCNSFTATCESHTFAWSESLQHEDGYVFEPYSFMAGPCLTATVEVSNPQDFGFYFEDSTDTQRWFNVWAHYKNNTSTTKQTDVTIRVYRNGVQCTSYTFKVYQSGRDCTCGSLSVNTHNLAWSCNDLSTKTVTITANPCISLGVDSETVGDHYYRSLREMGGGLWYLDVSPMNKNTSNSDTYTRYIYLHAYGSGQQCLEDEMNIELKHNICTCSDTGTCDSFVIDTSDVRFACDYYHTSDADNNFKSLYYTTSSCVSNISVTASNLTDFSYYLHPTELNVWARNVNYDGEKTCIITITYTVNGQSCQKQIKLIQNGGCTRPCNCADSPITITPSTTSLSCTGGTVNFTATGGCP